MAIPDPAAPEVPDTGDTITRNAVFGFAAQISSGLFTAILTLYLARALGVTDYGVFALALGITQVMLRPSDGGISASAVRFVAEHFGDRAKVAGVLGMALRTRLISAAAVSLAVAALAVPIARLTNTPALAAPLRGMALALFGQAVLLFILAVFTALRRTSTGLILVASESIMEFTATVTIVALGGGVTGAAYGRAAGYVAGAAIAIVLLGRSLGRSPLFNTGNSPVTRREFTRFATAMWVIGAATAGFSVIDTILIGALLSAEAVGIFSAPLRLLVLLTYPGLAIGQGVAPRMARHSTDRQELEALELGIRYTVIVGAASIAVTTVWAAPIVSLALGSAYADSAAVLRGLTPFAFLIGLAPVVVGPLNYSGEGRRRIPLALIVLGLNALIDVILLPRIGVMGAVIGTDIGIALEIGVSVWLCHTYLKLPLTGVLTTFGRALLAAGAMAVVLALFGTHDLSAADWIAGVVLGLTAYAGTLLCSRELSFGEMRYLVTLPVRALRRD